MSEKENGVDDNSIVDSEKVDRAGDNRRIVSRFIASIVGIGVASRICQRRQQGGAAQSVVAQFLQTDRCCSSLRRLVPKHCWMGVAYAQLFLLVKFFYCHTSYKITLLIG
jgi:hypothetical protein